MSWKCVHSVLWQFWLSCCWFQWFLWKIYSAQYIHIQSFYQVQMETLNIVQMLTHCSAESTVIGMSTVIYSNCSRLIELSFFAHWSILMRIFISSWELRYVQWTSVWKAMLRCSIVLHSPWQNWTKSKAHYVFSRYWDLMSVAS